jgi:hypothetical protein
MPLFMRTIVRRPGAPAVFHRDAQTDPPRNRDRCAGPALPNGPP